MKSNELLNREAIAMVKAHLRVWAEIDDEKRLALARQVYSDNIRVIDPGVILSGQEEVSDFIGGLLKNNPGFQFEVAKPIETDHNMAILCWKFGPPSKPDTVSGEDIITIADSLITSILVFVDGATK